MTATRVPWWLSIPATFIPTHAAPVTAGPVLSRDDPGDVETFKQLACWLARRAPHCDLEDAEDFGHPAMTAGEVLAAWQTRMNASRWGIDVSASELATVLAWFKEHT